MAVSRSAAPSTWESFLNVPPKASPLSKLEKQVKHSFILLPAQPKRTPHSAVVTYHKDEDSEFRPVQLRGHLPGNAVLPISSLPHLPLHKAAIQAPAGTARAPASHF